MLNLFKKVIKQTEKMLEELETPERTYNPDKYKVVQLEDGRYALCRSVFEGEWSEPYLPRNTLNEVIEAANGLSAREDERNQVRNTPYKEA